MVKRDDSGSGLRAGFVRGDGLVQPPKKTGQPKPDETPAKPQPPVPEPAAPEQEELHGPTMTMQGVSGKKITGVVKVVKAARPPKVETPAGEEQPSAAPAATAASPAAAQAAPDQASQAASAPAAAVSTTAGAVARVSSEPAVHPEPSKVHVPTAEPDKSMVEPVAAGSKGKSGSEPAGTASAVQSTVSEARPVAASAASADAKSTESAAAHQPTETPAPAPVSHVAPATTPAADKKPVETVQPAAVVSQHGSAPRSVETPAVAEGGGAIRPAADQPQSDRPQSDRPYSPRPQGDRPQGDRPYTPRPQGDRPYTPRPQGDRPQGDRPYGDRPQGDRPYTPRPQGDRPQGDRPYGDRPQGDRPYSPRPQGDRPYGERPSSDRPQGDRPQGDRPYTPRPQGDRPPYGGDRPFAPRPQGGDRPPYGGDRPFAPRPQGDRPYGDRPQGDRPQGDRPYPPRPQGDRPYGDRPQGDRPYGDRPQGDRPYTPRPQGDRPQGDRPYAPRPQGDRPYTPRPQGDRPYGDRPQGDRPYGDRPQGDRGPGSGARGPGSRARTSAAGVPDELREKAAEPRSNIAARDAFEKEIKRDDKREPKKEAPKTANDNKDKHRNLKQQAQVLSGQGVSAALSDETILDTLYKEQAKPSKNRQVRGGRRGQSQTPVVRAVLTHVKLPNVLTVKEFAEAIKKTAAEVIKKLMKAGMMATVNQEIDFDTATIIAEEFGITTEKLVEVTEEDILFDDSEDDEGDLKPRPPVVVVMGHVDHGKTSILDRIRSASVASGEAGGITQHIGAYTVRAKNRQITFLDTPGHEAFTTMRARGAQVTDIAILVVAADDGVMPQTIEAINHARAANTQIVVAINKIDKEGANIESVKRELSTHDLIPEEWGGSTVMVPVSAKTGAGIDDLLEMVLLTADILDLKANPDKQAKGTVIEAKLDKNRGPVATVLVQRGTLRNGDTLVTGSIIGHVRAMSDDKGNMVKKAGPSIPVEVLGLPEVPEAGELFYAVTDDKVARTLADRRRVVQREQQLRSSSRMSLDTLYSQMAAGEVKDLNLIIKADVQGSTEAVRQSLDKLTSTEVRVNIIHAAVGAITESDIVLAEVSNAIVIGFNVRPATNVADMAAAAGVDVRMYRVIYNAIEDIEAAMKGMLTPKFKEAILGHAQVRQVFRVSGVGSIGGCYVTDGRIVRSSSIRVVRDGIVIHEGKIASLRRFKDDAREVAAGFECGIGVERFNDIKENDIIEAFEMQEIERS